MLRSAAVVLFWAVATDGQFVDLNCSKRTIVSESVLTVTATRGALDGAEAVEFVLTVIGATSDIGWAAIGFGTDMFNTDMYVAYSSTGGTADVLRTFATATGAPTFKLADTEPANVVPRNVLGTSSSTGFTVTFSRLTNPQLSATASPVFTIPTTEQAFDMAYAYGKGSPDPNAATWTKHSVVQPVSISLPVLCASIPAKSVFRADNALCVGRNLTSATNPAVSVSFECGTFVNAETGAASPDGAVSQFTLRFAQDDTMTNDLVWFALGFAKNFADVMNMTGGVSYLVFRRSETGAAQVWSIADMYSGPSNNDDTLVVEDSTLAGTTDAFLLSSEVVNSVREVVAWRNVADKDQLDLDLIDDVKVLSFGNGTDGGDISTSELLLASDTLFAPAAADEDDDLSGEVIAIVIFLAVVILLVIIVAVYLQLRTKEEEKERYTVKLAEAVELFEITDSMKR
ncbi:hypothetical protein DIPPA_22127 [Diplonema papillatum]|nr:hypothetical protein DIPPA_22127 [Diplonema papillatum]